jgi:hypothetical protein
LAYLIISLGALMLIGGGAATILGLPYIVLESGFTQVIIGVVIATGGLVVMVGGAILREIRLGRAPAPGNMPQDRPEPTVAPSELSLTNSAPATGLPGAAGAMVVAGAAGVAAGHFADGAADRNIAARDDASAEDAEAKAASLDDPEHDVSSPEDASPRQGSIAAPDSETGQSDEAGKAVVDLNEATPPDQADRASTVIREEDERDLKPAGERLADAYDDLRQSLTLPLDRGDTPAASPHDFGKDDHQVKHEGKEEEAGEEAREEADEISDAPLAVVTDGAAVQQTPPDMMTGPVSSQEGVVSVRQIGESTYTMFADGTVRAMTPGGEKEYASIAELKADLALRL